ncbi:sigma-70 family RNA polymerase sigma factor [Roseibacterium beibuensis]|uniref:RNA polymerase sigma factor n=1 Tax=[Roseibacterium] beibuensis TaxID=1193142 RepID=UPI00217DA23E|nr:sigma-70 family RNA polymerase sigma factor [Roseibacterium beibuensis]MCS6624519.1 sigma-70 family RNA polymerase sigma factor [Roseibacterium beibuensis]
MTQNVRGEARRPGGDALADLNTRFARPLRSFFRKRACNEQEADDLVQEVFVRLAAREPAASMDHAEAYIFQIAANLLRDRARRQATRSAADRALEAKGGNSFEEISPERVLLGKQRLALLERVLGELPERTRVVFLLHRFEELKYAEIATRLEISVSSVEKHMMEAMRQIKTRFERD